MLHSYRHGSIRAPTRRPKARSRRSVPSPTPELGMVRRQNHSCARLSSEQNHRQRSRARRGGHDGARPSGGLSRATGSRRRLRQRRRVDADSIGGIVCIGRGGIHLLRSPQIQIDPNTLQGVMRRHASQVAKHGTTTKDGEEDESLLSPGRARVRDRTSIRREVYVNTGTATGKSRAVFGPYFSGRPSPVVRGRRATSLTVDLRGRMYAINRALRVAANPPDSVDRVRDGKVVAACGL